MRCCRGATESKNSKPWPENIAYGQIGCADDGYLVFPWIANLKQIGSFRLPNLTSRVDLRRYGTWRNPWHYRVEKWESIMHGLIYLVGLVVVVLAILSFFGLH